MKPRSKGLFHLLWPHAKPFRLWLVGIFLLGSLTALSQQSTFLMIKPTWDLMFEEQQLVVDPEQEPSGSATGDVTEEAFAGFKIWLQDTVLGDDPDTSTADGRMGALKRVCAILVVIALIGAVASYAFVLLSRWVAMQMVVSLRISVAQHLMALSLRYHSRRKFGDLLSRVSADVGMAMSTVNIVLRELIQEPLMGLTALTMAFLLAPQATLVVVFGLPLLVLPINLLLKRIRRGSSKSLGQLGASVQVLTQIFQGIRTVKAYSAEERELKRYRETNNKFIRTTMKMVRATALTRAWTILFTHAGMAGVLLVLGWLAIRGSGGNRASDLAPFFLFISKVYSSIKVTSRAWSKVAQARGACDRLQELLDETPDIVEREDARVCTGLGQGMIFDDVSFSYPEGDGPAIDGVSLEIRPGETLALVGPSGAGKTTMLDLIARFIDPDQGQVTVDGVDLRDLTVGSWTQRFSLVTQEPFLFHTSIEENIRYGKPDATHEEVVEASRAANIHDFIEGLPEGYQTSVADAGTRLSGGQRQRITIARAILSGGELLLLDEATSSLDTESEAVVQAALDELVVNRTVVVIAHRLSTIRTADRIAVLDEGRLVELGSHEELLEQGGLYARLHALQFGEPAS